MRANASPLLFQKLNCYKGENTYEERDAPSLDLEPGTYHWCACRNTKNEPFCDSSHKGTGKVPHMFKIIRKGTIKSAITI
ncbi:MAG: CDGSH iron-sulfur domain-containing protein [Candidatus Brocadia sp.]|nr:CDGSH iron-sulfur domain-containing protein [Candidatus Brocadia sp.]